MHSGHLPLKVLDSSGWIVSFMDAGDSGPLLCSIGGGGVESGLASHFATGEPMKLLYVTKGLILPNGSWHCCMTIFPFFPLSNFVLGFSGLSSDSEIAPRSPVVIGMSSRVFEAF
jgi:hypothetical protein